MHWFDSVQRDNLDALARVNRYTRREATPEERIGAIVLGAQKWPELKTLLPRRSPADVDCRRCEGQGCIPAGIICPSCSGLGFVARAP